MQLAFGQSCIRDDVDSHKERVQLGECLSSIFDAGIGAILVVTYATD